MTLNAQSAVDAKEKSNFRPIRLIAGNWKMNHTPEQARAYLEALRLSPESRSSGRPQRAVLFPSFFCLTSELLGLARSRGVSLGAQNAHWAPSGAFTGEISSAFLIDQKVNWVLLGHSERRQYFGESDESASKRLKACLDAGLNVVYCIGETLEQRERGETLSVLERQLTPFLSVWTAWLSGSNHLAATSPDQERPILALAYEPVWAIGTGRTATPEQAQEAHQGIRRFLSQQLRTPSPALEAHAQRLPLLYGGSVTAENAESLLSQPDVDGALIGGASLKADVFARIWTIASSLN